MLKQKLDSEMYYFIALKNADISISIARKFVKRQSRRQMYTLIKAFAGRKHIRMDS